MSPSPGFDPGLTQQYAGELQRSINKDGSFNVRRSGFRGLAGNLYLHLINMSWPRFFTAVTIAYTILNAIFALIYVGLGPDAIHASEHDPGLGPFGLALFFSVQTVTTVGYGSLYPRGIGANTVAAVEAAIGLMGFALATGLLFARFSRPTARMMFSDTMVIAPYMNMQSLQFRVANQRANVLMRLEASVLVMTVAMGADGRQRRNYTQLKLERANIYFLPLTWTIVHPIEEDSPFFGKSSRDLGEIQAEVLILIRAFDDTFSQEVHARYSYRWDEIRWSARIVPAFSVSPAGYAVLEVDKLSETSAA